MAEPFEYSHRRQDGGSLDEVLRPQGALVTAQAGQHKLDSEEARRELRHRRDRYAEGNARRYTGWGCQFILGGNDGLFITQAATARAKFLNSLVG